MGINMNFLRQAQELQERIKKLQEELVNKYATGSSGGDIKGDSRSEGNGDVGRPRCCSSERWYAQDRRNHKDGNGKGYWRFEHSWS
jgi:hypothetical protein